MLDWHLYQADRPLKTAQKFLYAKGSIVYEASAIATPNWRYYGENPYSTYVLRSIRHNIKAALLLPRILVSIGMIGDDSFLAVMLGRQSYHLLHSCCDTQAAHVRTVYPTNLFNVTTITFNRDL